MFRHSYNVCFWCVCDDNACAYTSTIRMSILCDESVGNKNRRQETNREAPLASSIPTHTADEKSDFKVPFACIRYVLNTCNCHLAWLAGRRSRFRITLVVSVRRPNSPFGRTYKSHEAAEIILTSVRQYKFLYVSFWLRVLCARVYARVARVCVCVSWSAWGASGLFWAHMWTSSGRSIAMAQVEHRQGFATRITNCICVSASAHQQPTNGIMKSE